MPYIKVKGHFIQKLLSRHTNMHALNPFHTDPTKLKISNMFSFEIFSRESFE